MAKQNARELLVKLGTPGATPEDPITYAVVCGLTTRNVTLNTNLVDVTSIDCANPGGPVWRETISGINSMDVTGNGFFENKSQFLALYNAQKSSTGHIDMEIVLPGAGKFVGKFGVGNMDVSGDLEGAVAQSINLQSSGEIVFTPEPDA